jgi:hypothetical protein
MIGTLLLPLASARADTAWPPRGLSAEGNSLQLAGEDWHHISDDQAGLPYDTLSAEITVGDGPAKVSLAGDPTGTKNDNCTPGTNLCGNLWIAHAVDVAVTHQDGSVSTESNDVWNVVCLGLYASDSYDLTSLLKPGTNTVKLTLRSECLGFVGHSPLWLIGDFNNDTTTPDPDPDPDPGPPDSTTTPSASSQTGTSPLTGVSVTPTGTTTSPPPTPAPAPAPAPGVTTPIGALPYLDAGTFLHVGPSGQACTSGPNARDAAGHQYMLVAKHCIDGQSPGNDQTTNAWVAAASPSSITAGYATKSGWISTANIADVDCTPPPDGRAGRSGAPVLSAAANCILPSDSPVPSTGDMAAVRIPAATHTRPRVQTRLGVQKVRGTMTIQQIDDQHRKVCHYGQGIHGEACGKLVDAPSHADAPNALSWTNTKAVPGDSGGPAYVYSYNNKGAVNGVFIVGLVLAGLPVDHPFYNKTYKTSWYSGFVPVQKLRTQLGVRILTT